MYYLLVSPVFVACRLQRLHLYRIVDSTLHKTKSFGLLCAMSHRKRATLFWTVTPIFLGGY